MRKFVWFVVAVFVVVGLVGCSCASEQEESIQVFSWEEWSKGVDEKCFSASFEREACAKALAANLERRYSGYEHEPFFMERFTKYPYRARILRAIGLGFSDQGMNLAFPVGMLAYTFEVDHALAQHDFAAAIALVKERPEGYRNPTQRIEDAMVACVREAECRNQRTAKEWRQVATGMVVNHLRYWERFGTKKPVVCRTVEVRLDLKPRVVDLVGCANKDQGVNVLFEVDPERMSTFALEILTLLGVEAWDMGGQFALKEQRIAGMPEHTTHVWEWHGDVKKKIYFTGVQGRQAVQVWPKALFAR